MARQSVDADCEKMHNLLDNKNIDLDNCRKLIKSYIDLVKYQNLSSFLKDIDLLYATKKTDYWFVYSIFIVLLYFGQTKLFH